MLRTQTAVYLAPSGRKNAVSFGCLRVSHGNQYPYPDFARLFCNGNKKAGENAGFFNSVPLPGRKQPAYRRNLTIPQVSDRWRATSLDRRI